ncbi:hypothetical protein FA13DRAFT_1717161 [Coprinellus micaceus]|uniref:Uncharacterized protein n=1 Tax=Coprinellus micaceus TaxID=71717 RepID=A0A4Y7SH17_COPMI|nr:hypothetical protein FA13DRAFT_1717161 [Coprinellus micaceus]
MVATCHKKFTVVYATSPREYITKRDRRTPSSWRKHLNSPPSLGTVGYHRLKGQTRVLTSLLYRRLRSKKSGDRREPSQPFLANPASRSGENTLVYIARHAPPDSPLAFPLPSSQTAALLSPYSVDPSMDPPATQNKAPTSDTTPPRGSILEDLQPGCLIQQDTPRDSTEGTPLRVQDSAEMPLALPRLSRIRSPTVTRPPSVCDFPDRPLASINARTLSPESIDATLWDGRDHLDAFPDRRPRVIFHTPWVPSSSRVHCQNTTTFPSGTARESGQDVAQDDLLSLDISKHVRPFLHEAGSTTWYKSSAPQPISTPPSGLLANLSDIYVHSSTTGDQIWAYGQAVSFIYVLPGSPVGIRRGSARRSIFRSAHDIHKSFIKDGDICAGSAVLDPPWKFRPATMEGWEYIYALALLFSLPLLPTSMSVARRNTGHIGQEGALRNSGQPKANETGRLLILLLRYALLLQLPSMGDRMRLHDGGSVAARPTGHQT